MSGKPKKVFVAIPSQGDTPKMHTMLALVDGLVDGLIEGIALEIHGYAGVTPISSARNLALAEFKASDCEEIVYIDDDLAWEKGALVKLIKHPVDLVLGAYRGRVDPEVYPVRHLLPAREIWADPKTGLIEIEGAGFGFAKVSRRCVEEMVSAYSPALEVDRSDAPNGLAWHLFAFELRNRQEWSEDMTFARRWRDIGGNVWLDPEITFMHIGNKGFVGKYGDWLRSKIVAPPQFSRPVQSAA